MNIKSSAKITGWGAYVPDKILSNYDLESMVDTNDEWILRRTGIRERRIAGEEEFASHLAIQAEEFASHLAIQAVEDLINKKKVSIADVDMIIVSTFTPDHMAPTVASLVQAHFGIKGAGTMDVHSGCTGFVYALFIANALITCGNCKKILVIAAETTSKVVDYTDRNTCILFGDGAAGALVEKSEDRGSFIASQFVTDGHLGYNVTCSNFSQEILGHRLSKKGIFQQEGKFLYEYVMKNIPAAVEELIKKAEMTLEHIQWFIPHSANLRMIEAICGRIPLPMEKTLISNMYYGNTSSATIPLAIWMAQDKIQSGDKMVLYGFGAGLTHGGLILEW